MVLFEKPFPTLTINQGVGGMVRKNTVSNLQEINMSEIEQKEWECRSFAKNKRRKGGCDNQERALLMR